jgi:hypothetical protein
MQGSPGNAQQDHQHSEDIDADPGDTDPADHGAFKPSTRFASGLPSS